MGSYCELTRSRLCRVAVVLISLTPMLLTSQGTHAEDWLQFRGPDARGFREGADLPDTWSETENVLWKTPLAGRAWSSPIITGDHIYLTTVIRESGDPEKADPGLYFGGNRAAPDDVVHDWQLVCLSLENGEQLWSRSLHKGKPQRSRHLKNSYSSETPVTDGERVYVLIGDVGIFCLTVDGEPVWSQELPPVQTRFDWGPAASPVLHGDRLFVVSDNENNSWFGAFDKKTGEQIFRVERDEKTNWATPFVWENELRTEVIIPATGKTRSYDLDGNLLYEFGGASSITIATPYSAHGLLYVSSGYVNDEQRPIFAIRPGASGDISLKPGETSNEFIVWSQPQEAPYNPTTLVYGDQLYVLHDRGFMTSFDARTGKMIYDKQRLPRGRAFTTSPWAADDRIFCLNEFGETFVVQAGPEFKLLHINRLDSQQLCMATPAIVNDKLILRTGDALYCIGK